MAKTHIYEIQNTLTDLDGSELFVVSNPNGQNGYSTSKLTLNSLAEFVNGGITPSAITINGIISEEDKPLHFDSKDNDNILKLYTENQWMSTLTSIGSISNCIINCSGCDFTNVTITSTKLDNCIVNLNNDCYITYQEEGDNSKIIIFKDVPNSGIVIPANIFQSFEINTLNSTAKTNGYEWIVNSYPFIETEFTSSTPGIYNFVLGAGTYDYVAVGGAGNVCGRTTGGDTVTHAATGDSSDVVIGWFTIDTDSIATAYVASGDNSEFTQASKGNSSSSGRYNTYLEISGTRYIDAPHSGGYLISGERPTDSGYSWYHASHASTYTESNKAVTQVIRGKTGRYGYSAINSSSSVPATAYADAEYPYGGCNGFSGNLKYNMVQKTMNNNGYLKLTKRAD